MDDDFSPTIAAPRRIGRPKGSKNRRTLVNEAKAAKLEADSATELIRRTENAYKRKRKAYYPI